MLIIDCRNAQSNVAPAAASAPATPAVPTNMAAGTANNPLAGLTGARYAGHMGLPGADMFGADGGVSEVSQINSSMLKFLDGRSSK